MKKIIFITPQFKNGGGNRVFIELANSIVKLGTYELDIAYPNNSNEINHYKLRSEVNRKPIGRLAKSMISKLGNVFFLFKYLINELKSNNEVFLVISDPLLCMFLWVFPRKYYSRVIRFVQADDYNLYNDLFILKNSFFLFIFKRLTKVSYMLDVKYVFNSTFSYDKFIFISNRNDVEKLIIHPAVDKSIFYGLIEEREQRAKINLCLVGRDHPLKKLDNFIDVWNRLPISVKSKVNKVFLISTDKLDRFNLEGLSLIRPKSDIEIADVFRESDIFISTSLWEGFSMPPLEAMNCGAVVLSSDSGGINEYAFNDYNSLLYEPGDCSELHSKLCRLIEDKGLRDYLKEKSKVVVTNFSWDMSAEKVISIIENKVR